MLSPADLTLAIVLVGDTPDGVLAAQAPAIASLYSYDTLYPGFQLELLYVQRDLTKVAHGACWQQIQTASADVRLGFQDRAKALQGRLVQLEAEIAAQLAQARASVAGVSTGVMTTTAPTTPPYPAPYPDGNSPAYQGSPYVTPPDPQGQQGTGW